MANGYGFYLYPDNNIRADTDTFIQKFADPNPYPIFGWQIRIWANPYPFYPFDTPTYKIIVFG